MRRVSSRSRGAIPSVVGDELARPGRPMDPAARAWAEPRFGHDFSDVRIHDDFRAAESAEAVGARAYTVENDIVLGRNGRSRETLAHELVHTLQQGAARSPGGLVRARPGAVLARQSDAGVPLPAGVPMPQPPQFPTRGIRVIGPHANRLVQALQTCTGLRLNLSSSGLLSLGTGRIRTTQASATARTRLTAYLTTATTGVIIDTGNPAIIVGQFDESRPGYQRVDMEDIRVLAGASGAGGGLNACSAIMHEIAEAFAGRTASQRPNRPSGRLYPAAHQQGVQVESAIRRNLGLPTGRQAGDMVNIARDPRGFIMLHSFIFGSGTNARTQLSVVRAITVRTGARTSRATDIEFISSHVVRGVVRFSTPAAALRLYNQYRTNFRLPALQAAGTP